MSAKVVVLQPPSPPGMNVKRDYAGGMGIADPSDRQTFGHDAGYITLPYMSLLYSAAVLERAGFRVSFIDGQAEGLSLDGVAERVRREAPAVVIGVVNLPSIHGDLQALAAARAAAPGARSVAVGVVAQALFDEVAGAGAADAVVRGDPERVVDALVPVLLGETPLDGSGFERRWGVITNAQVARVEDLDALPDLPYHLVPVEKYRYHGFGRGVRYAAVFASRGCPFKCYYCPYPAGFGGRIVARDPAKVVDEIERLRARFGVGGVLFRDQVFTHDRQRTLRLCDEMIRRRLDIGWVVETRLDRVDAELLRKMKEAGCVRIHYGLESGDPRLFARVGKDGVEQRMEQLVQNFRLTEQAGIHPHMFVLIGLLGETRESVRATIATIRRIKPLTLQAAIVTPYPGTGLFEEAERKGLLCTRDWSQYTGFKPIMRTEALSLEELVEARNLILREHARAVFWKRQRRTAGLALRYLRDGSVWGRVARRIRAAGGTPS